MFGLQLFVSIESTRDGMVDIGLGMRDIKKNIGMSLHFLFYQFEGSSPLSKAFHATNSWDFSDLAYGAAVFSW